MTIEKSALRIDGFFIQSYLFLPDNPPKKVALLFHGQGDFILRYEEIVQRFTDRGIAVIGVDFPGHGNSSGKRGDIPSFAFIDQLTEHLKKEVVKRFSIAISGMIAHSMGGLLLLRELSRYQTQYDFAFISSPLLRPEKNKSPLEIYFLSKLRTLFPKITISTGVNRDSCRRTPSKRTEKPDSRFHRRISLRWGYNLIHEAPIIRRNLQKLKLSSKILVIQGTEDRITPLEYSQPFFETLSWDNLKFQIIDDALHEPFKDISKDNFFESLETWLD